LAKKFLNQSSFGILMLARSKRKPIFRREVYRRINSSAQWKLDTIHWSEWLSSRCRSANLRCYQADVCRQISYTIKPTTWRHTGDPHI